MLPRKNFEKFWIALHFARFHGGEREKGNVEQLKGKDDRQRLIV